MILTNLNAETVACVLLLLLLFRKLRHKPNLECTSKYGFPAILFFFGGGGSGGGGGGGLEYRFSEHAHASYPGLSFRPPGFSPYRGREERQFRDWSKHGRVFDTLDTLETFKAYQYRIYK